MKKKTSRGFQRLIKATEYTVKGIRAAWINEEAFRQEIIVLIAVVPLSMWIGCTPFQKGVLIFSWLFVILIELINSAIEAVVDRIGNETNELSARAKDMGSAAVFVSICASILIWLAMIYEKLAG